MRECRPRRQGPFKYPLSLRSHRRGNKKRRGIYYAKYYGHEVGGGAATRESIITWKTPYKRIFWGYKHNSMEVGKTLISMEAGMGGGEVETNNIYP